MREKFTKSDLKDGMIVETRNFSKYIVLKDRIIGTDGAMGLEEYEEDLLLCEDSRDAIEDEYDIMAVYEFCSNGKYPSILDVLNGDTYLKIIWERKEVKHMTVDEMREELEKLTGEKIEVIEVTFKHNNALKALREHCHSIEDCNGCQFNEDCPFNDHDIDDKGFINYCFEKLQRGER